MRRACCSGLIVIFCAAGLSVGAEKEAATDGDKNEPSTIEAETVTNRRFALEQEGFARALNVSEEDVPICGTVFWASSFFLRDFRGAIPEISAVRTLVAPTPLNKRASSWPHSSISEGSTW